MPIPIKKEPKDISEGFGSCKERCHFCNNQTIFWHLASNTPVCIDCAEIKDITDIIKPISEAKTKDLNHK